MIVFGELCIITTIICLLAIYSGSFFIVTKTVVHRQGLSDVKQTVLLFLR